MFVEVLTNTSVLLAAVSLEESITSKAWGTGQDECHDLFSFVFCPQQHLPMISLVLLWTIVMALSAYIAIALALQP